MLTLLRPAPVIAALAAWTLACACGGEAKTTAAADASSNAGDATATADTSATGDASRASDVNPADSSAADSAATDSGDATASPAQSACAALASAICSGSKACCGGAAPASCEANWTKGCLKLGWADLDDALASGALQKDGAAQEACQAAVAAAIAACDQQAAQRALGQCLRAWMDPAKVGEPCAAPVELACAAGGGRCTAKTIDVYVCSAAVGEGASCSVTQPCQTGLECLDSGLTRAKTCGKPGSTCNLADKCWDGWTCQAGACVKASGSAPSTCSKDEDCPTTQVCSGGKCLAKLCQ